MRTLATRALPVLALAALPLALSACNFPGMLQAPDVNAIASMTLEALATDAEATRQAGIQVPSSTPVPPLATNTPDAGEASATPVPTVVHEMMPGNPVGVSSYMTDRSSAATGADRYTVGENYDLLLLERPFTSQSMDYQGHVDLVRAELSAVSPWMYVTIYLVSEPPEGGALAVGVEIDANLDGRGDWLILADVPPSTEWTVAGVRAYRDSNGDVGGKVPLRSDPPPQTGDGYDNLIFDQGQGADPDAAWVRRAPSGLNLVQIAFKQSLINLDDEFLWGAWSDAGVKQPGWFDYNDHFSLADAGSPLQNNPSYPIKALAEVDNTCRWAYGFNPVGTEPGVCFVPSPTPTPTASLTPVTTQEPIP